MKKKLIDLGNIQFVTHNNYYGEETMKQIMIFSLFLLFTKLFTIETITKSEIEQINDLLEQNGLVASDLKFIKDWASDTKFKLPTIIEILNDPMQYPKFVDEIREKFQEDNIISQIEFASAILWENLLEEEQIDYDKIAKSMINKEKDILDFVELLWEDTDKIFTKTFLELEQTEFEKLQYFVYSIYMENADSLKYDHFFAKNNIKKFDNSGIEEIIPVIEKVDFQALSSATMNFQKGYNALIKTIETKNFFWKKSYKRKTRWGNFLISSQKDDDYKENYSFILDPDGDDRYLGEINTSKERPFFMIIDLEGNDLYQNNEIGGLFSSFFGLGIHSDLAGNDVYQGDDFTFSSFFGYSHIENNFGNDVYTTGLHSLAAASYGISIFTDTEGNDTYSATELSQGFAGTLGWGILNDKQGNDSYFSGGKYLHAPLAPNDYRSLSQGFGYGLRPDLAGGIGILYDQAGNDRYNGGVYAQGVAYWYALGILLDEAGNDFYNAVYYPQGSGIHLAGGFLFDAEGEDHYFSKHGPGQGAGHDYAVGFLIDRAGNDNYSVEGGNGLGLTNSVGIFLDVEGDDQYQNSYEKNYGFVNKSRDSGGIGIFLDTDGNDKYPFEHTKNDTSWTNGFYGIGKDISQAKNIEPLEEIAEKDVQIDPTAVISEIFSIAAEWGVGNNKKRVDQASEILLKRDLEAAEYIYQEQLGTKSSLTYRAIKNYAKKSVEFNDILIKALEHSDSLWVKNSISLLGETADSTSISNLQQFLIQKKYINTTLSALGKMKTDKATEILKNYGNSNSEKTRVIVARGLKKIDTELSRKYLFEMKDDDSFLIKTMIKFMEKENREE